MSATTELGAAAGTASGKNAGTENFPVGSWLLDPRDRPLVMAFYRFARAADDIADHPSLEPEDKLARLDALGRGLEGEADEPLSRALREACLKASVTLAHAHDLLEAFRLDVTKRRYRDWDDLMAYCAKSAMPVGRFMLDVHGEDRATWPASDALCAALQVINHLQDCADDFTALDRVYVPLDALAQAGETPSVLCNGRLTPDMRRVLDGLLDRTAALLRTSRDLAPQVRHWRLRLEVAVIQTVAESLVALLRRRDPLRVRVALSGGGYARCVILGIWRGLTMRRAPSSSAVAAGSRPGLSS